MKHVVKLAFVALGLTACSGSTTVVQNTEPKVVGTYCAYTSNPDTVRGFPMLVYDDGTAKPYLNPDLLGDPATAEDIKPENLFWCE